MTPRAKKALTIAVVAGGALLLLGGVANAADKDDEDDEDDEDGGGDTPEVIIVDPPIFCPPGQVLVNGECVVPPPAPNPINCNYVGCGPAFQWVMRDRYPTERSLGLALQQLGYIINPAADPFSIVSNYNRSIVRQFQRDYNVARLAQTVEAPPPSLSTDGLVGNNTIRGIARAHAWQQTLALPWLDIVALG